MFWSFGSEACRILAPQPGFKPAPPALEGEVLTAGPTGNSGPLVFMGDWISVLTYAEDSRC